MNNEIKSINGLDEYMRDGEPSYPRYEPLDQIYNDHAPRFQHNPQSEFMQGFEEWLDGCAAMACILIFGPFLLMLGFLSLPIMVPYSIFYLIKRISRSDPPAQNQTSR